MAYSEPLLELDHVDDTAAMGTITYLAVAIPSFDFEYHAFAIKLNDAGNGADPAADRSCGEVTNVHLNADANKAIR